MVAEVLGDQDPWELSDRYPLRSPLNLMGSLVATAAREVDDRHGDLARAARSAIRNLEPLTEGRTPPQERPSDGSLDAGGTQLEVLSARRNAAYRHLTSAVTAYRQLREEAARTASGGLGPVPERRAEEAPRKNDDWAIAGDRQTQALRAVERGGLRLKQSALSDQDRYLSDGTGASVPVWAKTIERLLADGLLDIDTTATPTQGQLLSLTSLGKDALQTADGTADTSTQTTGASDAAVDPLPTREELLALEEIKRGRVLLQERAFRSGLRVDSGSGGARIAATTVEGMSERGWIERDTSTSLTFGQRLSLSEAGEKAFGAGCAQDPRTTAALSRSTPKSLPSSPALPGAAGTHGQSKPTRSR
nr:hypothetical protein [Streptomyces sp. SID4926]